MPEILKNVILTEQGKAPEIKSDCTVDISVSAYIPKTYIASERTRIDIYKRIAAISSKESFDDCFDELCDRFKRPPECTVNLMRISLIRNMARSLHISDIKQRTDNIVFYFSALEPSDVERVHAHYGANMMFSPGERPYITIRPDGKAPIDRMEEFLEILAK